MCSPLSEIPKAERANEQLRPRPRNAQAHRVAQVWGLAKWHSQTLHGFTTTAAAMTRCTLAPVQRLRCSRLPRGRACATQGRRRAPSCQKAIAAQRSEHLKSNARCNEGINRELQPPALHDARARRRKAWSGCWRRGRVQGRGCRCSLKGCSLKGCSLKILVPN